MEPWVLIRRLWQPYNTGDLRPVASKWRERQVQKVWEPLEYMNTVSSEKEKKFPILRKSTTYNPYLSLKASCLVFILLLKVLWPYRQRSGEGATCGPVVSSPVCFHTVSICEVWVMLRHVFLPVLLQLIVLPSKVGGSVI